MMGIPFYGGDGRGIDKYRFWSDSFFISSSSLSAFPLIIPADAPSDIFAMTTALDMDAGFFWGGERSSFKLSVRRLLQGSERSSPELPCLWLLRGGERSLSGLSCLWLLRGGERSPPELSRFWLLRGGERSPPELSCLWLLLGGERSSPGLSCLWLLKRFSRRRARCACALHQVLQCFWKTLGKKRPFMPEPVTDLRTYCRGHPRTSSHCHQRES